MMMACINALLYPKYSLSNPIYIRNTSNMTREKEYKVIYEEKQTELMDIENVPPENKNITKQNRINESNRKSFNDVLKDVLKEQAAIENNNTIIGNSINNTTLCFILKYGQIEHRNKTYINLHAIRYNYGNRDITENFIYNTISWNTGYCNDDTINSICNDYIIKNNKRNECININIKHLKIFILANNINNININRIGLYLYIYLNGQSKIKYNLNKNTYINDIYSVYKINKYNWNHMPSIEEVTELYIRLPINLYNSIAIKILDLTFNDNGWHRLEELLNILCNTANGNLNGFNTVWWNMQTCWTSFKKNPEVKKKTKELIINCEAISDDDEEEIMIVYTIIDAKMCQLIQILDQFEK